MTSGDLQEDKHSLTQRVSELEFNLTAAEIEKKRAVDNEICAQDKLKAVIEEKAALEEKVKVVITTILITIENLYGPLISVAAPTLWNQLPADIRNVSSLENYKSVLKTPVQGSFHR